MYYKERTEFGTLSFSSDSTVGDDLLDELCRSAEIDRHEPVRPAASHNPTSEPRPPVEPFPWGTSATLNDQ